MCRLTILALEDGKTQDAADADKEDITPFAQITRFAPTHTTCASISAKDGVDPVLARLCPTARNTHVAFRLDGAFRSITVRTAGGQCRAGEGLAGVAGRQVTHTLGPARGTVVGFRSPGFLQGVSVAGVHMHFIDEERKNGGHVLALESEGEVEVKAAEVWRTIMDLPRNTQFIEASMELDDEGIRNVEG
jgi:alpha-acetolactate decarboxylase